MALEGKHEFVLYTKDGKRFVFNHKIDAMDALATGHLFEEVPGRVMAQDPVVEENPQKRGRGRPPKKKALPLKENAGKPKFEIEAVDGYDSDSDDA